MKKYDSYKDSDIEWLGKIPKHWKITKLKFIGNAIGGLTYTPNDVVENETKGKLVLRSSNIQDGKLSLNDNVYVNLEISDKLTLRKGDILICSRNGSQHLIGKNICIDERTEGNTFGAFMMIFRSSHYRFLNHFFNSPIFTSQSGLFLTATINQLTSGTLNNFYIAIPDSTEEQTTISKYLDHKIGQIDTLISKKEQFIKLLEEERTAIINQVVTKGLDPTVPMKDSGIEWLGEIPAHWEVKKLKYFADVVLGKMLTNEDKGGYQLKPYLRAKNIEWINPNINDVKEMWFSENEIIQYRIKQNDLLVSEGGEVGRTCIWKNELEECYIQNSVHKVTILEGEPNYFLNQFVLFGKCGHFDAIVNKISIAHLTKEKLKDIAFIVPSYDEQSKISKFIENKKLEIDSIIFKSKQEIELLKEYKTALISEVVTGKVDVREEILN